jgi:hypothetical protein
MARAGYCSECQENAYLGDDGGCPKGHGPGCVSGVYDVADEPAATVPSSAPAAYAAAPVTSAAAAPKKKRTGLVITLVIVALLLLCGCGVGAYFIFVAATGSSSNTTIPPAVTTRNTKAEIQAAFDFLKGLGSGDIELFKSVMPAETVKAVSKETWDSLMSAAVADPTKFGSLVWSGEKATADFSASDGSKGTMDFKIAGAKFVVITLKPEASESEDATLTVVQESGRWTVTAFETIDGVLEFDPESVKAMGQ